MPDWVTVAAAEAGRKPYSTLRNAAECRSAEPITSKGSPYSLCVHVAENVTRTPPSVQLIVEACWAPMLWPSSWAITRTESVPLMKLSLPGISAAPAQPHAATCGNR